MVPAKAISMVVFLLYLSVFPSRAAVEGKLNPRIINRFPRNILVVLPPSFANDESSTNSTPGISGWEKISSVFKQFGWFVLNAAWTKQKNGYCTYYVAYENPLKQEQLCVPANLPVQDALQDELKNVLAQYPGAQGLLFYHGNYPLPWMLDPWGMGSLSAVITLYDIETGEWAYRLDFKCPWLLSLCSVNAQEVSRYLWGDLNKKHKKIKFK